MAMAALPAQAWAARDPPVQTTELRPPSAHWWSSAAGWRGASAQFLRPCCMAPLQAPPPRSRHVVTAWWAMQDRQERGSSSERSGSDRQSSNSSKGWGAYPMNEAGCWELQEAPLACHRQWPSHSPLAWATHARPRPLRPSLLAQVPASLKARGGSRCAPAHGKVGQVAAWPSWAAALTGTAIP